MLEILKYGTSKYGQCWVIGTVKYQGFELMDIFNTNISDENFFSDKTELKIKKFKISRDRNKNIKFSLEF